MRKPGNAFHRRQSRRYAWPDPRKQRSGGNVSPWFLQAWGSRPSHKLTPALERTA